MYHSDSSRWVMYVNDLGSQQWGEKKCPFFTFSWATSSPKTILTDDWCSDGKMRWRAPSAGERWDGDRPTARWEGIKTAHWCCVNPRPACSWHLYLLRSHTRGCRRPTLPSCCRTAARMKAFWWTSPGVWTESGENREGGGASCHGSFDSGWNE